AGATIGKLVELPEVKRVATPREAIDRIQADLNEFRQKQRLDALIVANVASTEPPHDLDERFDTIDSFDADLHAQDTAIPASALYGWAALDLGVPYVNFTPSLGASFPAALELTHKRATVTCGKDGKTGETLLKTVLAPMFAHRNFQVL